MTLVSENDGAAAGPPQSRNHLLAVLPPGEYLELRPHLTSVRLEARARLAEPNREIEWVYFPIDAVISVAAVDGEDDAVEVGSIGCERIKLNFSEVGFVAPFLVVFRPTS